MAKLGPYSYPDIRFGDAVHITERIHSKFKGSVSVKGLAWELGMAEGSGTLFAKVAALRDFGLIEGRGEIRVSPLAEKILRPLTPEEGKKARAEAFQKVDLLRQLYYRFEGEIPDDLGVLVGLEEITKAPREEIIRRASLIQKHLTDAVRALGRPDGTDNKIEYSGYKQNNLGPHINVSNAGLGYDNNGGLVQGPDEGLAIRAGALSFSSPLSVDYIDVAISLLNTVKTELNSSRESTGVQLDVMRTESGSGRDMASSNDFLDEELESGSYHEDLGPVNRS